ncbi:MAG: DUF4350 domain-containing protein [Acidimicrobiales bacterium]
MSTTVSQLDDPFPAPRQTAAERWGRLALRWRIVLVAVAAVIFLYFAGSLVGGIYQPPTTTPTGSSSSLDATPTGAEALARLLAAEHHSVRSLTEPLSQASLPTDGTLFVLDPAGALTPAAPALERYLYAGGHVVLGGQVPASVLRALLGTAAVPVWLPAPSGAAHPVVQTDAVRGVSTVLGGPDGSFSVRSAPGLTILLRGPGGVLALGTTVGRGTLVLLASSAPLQNALLAGADDAAFALDLAAPASAPVAFDEYDHGLGRAGTGLAGLPAHWKAGLVLVLLAALVWMWSAARRFGPPQQAERELIPPRVAHVDAMAALLASGSTDRLAAAASPLREQGRTRLRRVLRADPGTSDEQLAALAGAGGTSSVSPEAVTALLGTPRSAEDIVAEGRAFVALDRDSRPR